MPVPQVVLLLAGGILIGPEVLDLGSPADVQVLADVGLGFVFLLAGYEFDLRLFRRGRRPARARAWPAPLMLAVGVVALLAAPGWCAPSSRSRWG